MLETTIKISNIKPT